MRRLVLASHEKMAFGTKCTLDFITNNSYEIFEISAYTDNEDLGKKIQNLLSTFSEEDEVVILTDMLSGSVNQQFIPYRNDHVFLIAGFNLPLVLEILLLPQETKLSNEKLTEIIENSKTQIQLVCNCDDLDEDE